MLCESTNEWESAVVDERPVKVLGPVLRVGAFLLLAGVILVGIAQYLDHTKGVSIPAGTTRVDVTLDEFHITTPKSVLPGGKLAFVVHNAGSSPHELVVFRTKLTAKRLPRRPDGDANEESRLLTGVVDSGASLAPNQTKVFVATLPPGHYVAVCNLPGHYRLGMRIDLTVG